MTLVQLFLILLTIIVAFLIPALISTYFPSWHEMKKYRKMDAQKQREHLIKKYLDGRIHHGWEAAFKGFHNGMVCMNNFKYEEGKTYVCPDDPILCFRGFHACLAPRDVYSYYHESDDVYHIVFLQSIAPKSYNDIFREDTKVCAKRIKIGPRIDSRYITK